MKYQIYVDSLGIRIESDRNMQQDIVNNIRNLTESVNLPFVASKHNHESNPLHRHSVFKNNRRVAVVSTSAFVKRTQKNSTVFKKTIYYTKIEFAGLKSYHKEQDELMLRYMISVFVLLNKNKIPFKLINLDTSLDIFNSKFKHILGLCSTRVPNTKYFKLNAQLQPYMTTQYIELPSNRSVSTAYLYDKAEKEKIDDEIVRMEIKMKPRFFNVHGLDFTKIDKTLKRYHVLYFKRLTDKQALCAAYDAIENPKQRDIKKLHLEQYKRLEFDIRRIERFIGLLFEADNADEYYDILHEEFYNI